MPTQITLSDETFVKLQRLARPLVDTTESVIASLADAELLRRPADDHCITTPDHSQPAALILNPDSPQNLKHTRVLSASVDDTPLHRPKWNGIMDHLHVVASRRMDSFEAIVSSTHANIREGVFEEHGYRFLPEAGLSIQGVDSNDAWNYSLFIARQLAVAVHVEFEWRNKEGAARPGERALMDWTPRTS